MKYSVIIDCKDECEAVDLLKSLTKVINNKIWIAKVERNASTSNCCGCSSGKKKSCNGCKSKP